MREHLSFQLLDIVYVYSQQLPNGVMPFMELKGIEGPSYILKKTDAQRNNSSYIFPCRCLLLNQQTKLSAVGITAKIATALASEKIPCNVVAGYHHDYFFVPEENANRALHILQTI